MKNCFNSQGGVMKASGTARMDDVVHGSRHVAQVWSP